MNRPLLELRPTTVVVIALAGMGLATWLGVVGWRASQVEPGLPAGVRDVRSMSDLSFGSRPEPRGLLAKTRGGRFFYRDPTRKPGRREQLLAAGLLWLRDAEGYLPISVERTEGRRFRVRFLGDRSNGEEDWVSMDDVLLGEELPPPEGNENEDGFYGNPMDQPGLPDRMEVMELREGAPSRSRLMQRMRK